MNPVLRRGVVLTLGILLAGLALPTATRAQENAAAWRAEIRQRLGQEET